MKNNPGNQKGSSKHRNMSVPWGRAGSLHRPGVFAKKYLAEHGEASAADVFSALRQELKRINQERVEIGDKAIRGCTYNSFAKYWHWFKLLGLIERTNKPKPARYVFLQKKVFYKLTKAGMAEVRAWEDPIQVTHSRVRVK